MAKKTERQRDAERKRRVRLADRDLVIPPVRNPRRKRACERNILKWLRTYFPDSFTRDFTPQQKQMVHEILQAARYGGDKAIAAPRGEGKTTIVECVILFCILTGLLRFPLIACATGPDAERILDNVKKHLERSDVLYEDYPEACHPIRDLRGAPQRAGSQTVGGERTWLEWRQDRIVLPTVWVRGRLSRASGAIVMTRGLDAAVRGIRVGVTRPDFVLLDDPETRESVKSEEQTKTRRLTIEQDIAGLGGGDKRLSRVILTTIMRRATNEGGATISFEYTDPAQRASWRGERFQLLERWPERSDLWEEYVSLRQADQQAGDEHARRSHRFYLDNRAAMDDGAAVANPARFNAEKLPDGTHAEESALQRAYNIIADRGLEHFETEYQNNPPEETGPVESGITAFRVQTQVNGYPRRLVPPGVAVLVQSIDVGKRLLHYVVRGFAADGTGFTIDYDVVEVYGTVKGSDDGVDLAIRRAILDRMDAVNSEPYRDAAGEIVPLQLTLIDASYRTEAVYQACRDVGLGILPAMGVGMSAGCVQAKFHEYERTTRDKSPGDGWFLSRKGDMALVIMDSDRWKAWEHDRWMTAPGRPGAMTLFGESGRSGRMSEDEKGHRRYAANIVSEVEIEEVVKGVLKRRWKAKTANNHYFDASYMTDVAANMRGIRLLTTEVQQPQEATAESPSVTREHVYAGPNYARERW